MTFDECREHAGERVTYLAGSLFPGDGVITSVATTRVFVRLGKDKFSTAAYPEELTLQEQPS